MKKSVDSKSRLLIVVTLLITLLSISYSCTKSSIYNTPSGSNTGSSTGSKGGSVQGANEVWIQGMAFSPSSIAVSANTTITWTNKDAIGHTVTSDTGLFDSGTIGTNGTYSYTFATAGTFMYHCKVHPSMTASVTVGASATPVTTPGTMPVTTPGY
jgi:plastocyanin